MELLPANQLAVEPICSWRLNVPYLELKVSSDRKNVRYSVYNHHPGVKCYWPSSASSSIHLTPVFAHCVWKGSSAGPIESRLFSDKKMAVFISVNPRTEKIGIKEWDNGDLHHFLITYNPVISAINDDHSLEFQEERREIPRSVPYALEAEEGVIRWCRTEEGELFLNEGEPATEETMKVWHGDRDIRLIKFTCKLQKQIMCRVFDWASQENSEIHCRFAPGSEPRLSNVSTHVNAVIRSMKKYTPELEHVANEEVLTFYKEHPLNCFMPGYVLSRTLVRDVQRWVYQQFYRKEGENIERFEYTNFISAKKISFSFNEKAHKQNKIGISSEIEAWHIEMKRQAGWALQLPIGISEFFLGMFSISAQNPSEVDKKAMERLVQGVPMRDPERNKIIDDFAAELGACSTINFYIACDRSVSQLEISGRAWVRSFASTGRDVRGVIVDSGKWLANTFRGVNLQDINHTIEDAAKLGESVNKARIAWKAVKEITASEENPAD